MTRNLSPTPATEFKPWPLIAAVVLVMIIVNLSMHWIADTVSLPRYCENTDETIGYIEQLLTETNPVPSERRRGYIIAAKLLFLEPQRGDEPVDDYLQRLRDRIEGQCR